MAIVSLCNSPPSPALHDSSIAMASSKTLRTILDGLNSPPFSLELTPVKLDSLTPERLLQTVSDVVTWIQGISDRIDIREESADETAIRLLSALRTLKYPPPKDMDQVQGWRLGILEGRREELYPILAWIFDGDNVDRLKERVYLARYLTKLDIPPDVEQSSDVSKLLVLVASRMEQFKELHSRIVESRADYVRAEDIRQDLKTMAEEREQLLRRVERSKGKVAKRNDLQKALQLATRLRNEREQNQEVQIQRQEQRDGLVVAQQRLSRLERTLAETRKEREEHEPRTLIAKMKRESEVNRYLLAEKLPRDIEHARQGVDDMRRLVGMRDVSKDYIDELQSKIARVKAGIAALEAEEREREAATAGDGAVGNDEDDSLQLYRHQYANVLRRKATVADSLQAARRQLGSLESEVSRRRTELAGRSGGSANDVISNVQYKLLLNRLRTKNNAYKKMRAELEECRAEVQILERSIEVLEQRFDEVKEQNRLEGRGIIEEVADESELGAATGVPSPTPQRPRTAKPTTTDLSRLKEMVEEINAQLSRRREEIQRLRREIDQFYAEHREGNERFYASQAELEAQERYTIDHQRGLETELDTTEGQLQRLKAELERNKQALVKQRWFVENMESEQRCEQTMQALEKRHIECLKNISEANRELATLADRIDGKEQKVMWDSLVLILQTKIRLQEGRTDKDTPIGDGRYFGR